MRGKVLRIFMIVILIAVVMVAVAMILNGRIAVETNLTKSVLLGAEPIPLNQEVTLKAATFNIHDLYVVSDHRPERMRAIAQALTELDPDVVGIQESFIERDRQILLDSLRPSRLAYHHYYKSATVGCGLLVLSAYPIVEPFFHRYTHSGQWYKFYQGDWWAGKGVALARIQLPNGGYFDFYDTHTQARYGSDQYEACQMSQMDELVKFIKESALNWAPALLVGDMNSRLDSKPLQAAISGAGLERLMNVASRIDHIFCIENPRYKYEVLETHEIRKTIDVPGGKSELSDHPGYLSTIRISPQ